MLGLSTGGNEAAWMAHHRPDVRRIVGVAPAIKLARMPTALGLATAWSRYGDIVDVSESCGLPGGGASVQNQGLIRN